MSALPPAFQKIVDSLSAGRVNLVTAYALYYWELLALLPLEYKYVWRSKLSPIKVFYLLNRYVTLVIGWCNAYLTLEKLPLHLCQRLSQAQPMFSTVIITVYAIWNCDKRILILLCVWLTACATIMVAVSTKHAGLVLPDFLSDAAGFTNCLSTKTGKDNYWLVFLWTPPLTFDILILSLTVYRYFDLRHRTGGVEIPILRKIVMKHLFYFGVITTSNAINVGFFAQSDETLKPANAVLTVTLTSILSARLVLSLFAPAPLPLVKQTTMKSSDNRLSVATALSVPQPPLALSNVEAGSGPSDKPR
ncbi:hypothetical protein JCM5353_006374 [Sporobolomyces roseus]